MSAGDDPGGTLPERTLPFSESLLTSPDPDATDRAHLAHYDAIVRTRAHPDDLASGAQWAALFDSAQRAAAWRVAALEREVREAAERAKGLRANVFF
jgi:hypothetical protein